MTKRDRNETDNNTKSNRTKVDKLHSSTSETVNYVTHISWRKEKRELGTRLKGKAIAGAREDVCS